MTTSEAKATETRLSGDTLADVLRHWARHTPQALALSGTGASRTWLQTFERATRIAQGLLAAGVRPGERVGYFARNRPEYYEIAFAAAMAGAVLVALNWRLSGPEAASVLEHSEAVVLFAEPDLLEQLPGAEQAHTRTRLVVGLSAGPGPHPGYEPWLARFPAIDPERPAGPADPVLQVYTSGTTGLPKAALFSHSAIRATTGISGITGIGRRSVLLISIPVFHAAGGVMGLIGLSSGAHVVVSADASPEAFGRMVERYRVTMTVVVPTVLHTMVGSAELARAELSSLHTVAYAGAPMPPALQRACLARFGCRLVQLYGSTELIGVTGLAHEDHVDDRHPERRGSVGKPLPGVTVRVVDPESGIDRPEGVLGEVWAKASTAMIGYWRAPELTAEVLTGDGFVRTGDAGRVVDGYLYLGDRLRDMIITGGENVFPTEVENVLLEHPAIMEAAVVGAPSPKWGETVRAVVVRRPGSEVGAAEVVTFCRERLAHYKCPAVVEFAGALPRNASGKVLRRLLRVSGPK